MVASRVVESTDVEAAAACFRALADPNRLRILVFLSAESRCVCDVQAAVGIPPNLLSYHLRILREAGLVVATRRGRWVDYRLCERSGAMIGEAAEAAGLTAAACPSADGRASSCEGTGR